ncbi:MAG TPA: hypothetical protein VG500_15925 [Gemmatimonadales bacterium]|nr:hypothetical protein [Gemmatimonadales bacterium]
MFIELTDHLRCPADHQESYLVLLPDRMEERSVREGRLGCPVCGRNYLVKDGVLNLGGSIAEPPAATRLEPEALTALVGLGGPGGYLVLVGRPASGWRRVAELNPGVALVAVNPPADLADTPGVSVLRGTSLPLKSRSMRGVVLGSPYGGDPHWVAEGTRAVLPGLRVAGEGPVPESGTIELMATAGGVWVGTPRR